MDLVMPATLAASCNSRHPRVKQLLSLLLRHHRSSRASGVQHPIQVSRPSQQHRPYSHGASLLLHQQLQAGSSTTRDERSRSCDYWTKHMQGEWQQKMRQRQQSPPIMERLTLDADDVASQVCHRSSYAVC